MSGDRPDLPFTKVLVANRGEIAVRVLRACRELGLATVAVASEADRHAPHARLADETVVIGPAPPLESYLRVEAILDAARRTGAGAVHPGYGFLAENAGFAAACRDAGLVFVGPAPQTIAAMGEKTAARRLLQAAGVPLVPGAELPGTELAGAGAPPDGEPGDPAALREAAARVGYPLLVKAAFGGGGKGMRLVAGPAELPAAAAAAAREARQAFGDGKVYLERYLDRPRHVEFQVFGDARGEVVHLGERECSVQRRHQKIVEETPSPALTPELRARMGAAAVAAARAVGYVNAGTVEFLLDRQGRFYFLEMNTRLQVEHPVTEWVTGLDLVRAQLLVAGGAPLPWRQEEIVWRGHALECRLYAEDPAHGFRPSLGRLLAWGEPSGPGVRLDSGVAEGDEVTMHYDPLLAKLSVHGADRGAAIARALAGLRETAVLGVATNLAYLQDILDHPEFRAGRTHTHFLDEQLPGWRGDGDASATAALVAAALHASLGAAGAAAAGPGSPGQAGAAGDGPGPDAGAPWRRLGRFRLRGLD